jgi:hypothetical protein
MSTFSAAVTMVWCTSMSAMGEMPMPGVADHFQQPPAGGVDELALAGAVFRIMSSYASM